VPSTTSIPRLRAAFNLTVTPTARCQLQGTGPQGGGEMIVLTEHQHQPECFDPGHCRDRTDELDDAGPLALRDGG
jgi:hypothetical protein